MYQDCCNYKFNILLLGYSFISSQTTKDAQYVWVPVVLWQKRFFSLPNDKILDLSELETFAEDKVQSVSKIETLFEKSPVCIKNWNFIWEESSLYQKLKLHLRRVENNVGKWENAGYKVFPLFPTIISRFLFSRDNKNWATLVKG